MLPEIRPGHASDKGSYGRKSKAKGVKVEGDASEVWKEGGHVELTDCNLSIQAFQHVLNVQANQDLRKDTLVRVQLSEREVEWSRPNPDTLIKYSLLAEYRH